MATAEASREAIVNDLVRWAPEVLKIVPKDRSRGIVPLKPKPGQIALEECLQRQRAEGRAQRAIILKARQVGMSTWVQGKLIVASTQLPHVNSLTVVHEDDAVKKLYRIGERMYLNLPDEIRPERRAFKRGEYLHFGDRGDAFTIWPDSYYELNTAGAPESGRAGTYHRVHLSEYAFYPQPEDKFIAVMQGMTDHPDSLVVIESTPNGHNHFKSLWDEAVDGTNEFFPFFWPWWLEEEYALEFVNESDREEFSPGDLDQSPWAEEELDLLDPGPVNVLTGEYHPLTYEQLRWRRWAIANKCGGRLDKFHQEYPTSPEQAFLSTGAKVFEPVLVSRVISETEQTDPRYGAGGPVRGTLEAGKLVWKAGRHGRVEAPEEPKFKPARLLLPGEVADWRFWLPFDGDKPRVEEEDNYIIGGDVSEGLPESGEGDPAYQALVVIDHRTKVQVAEYRSRVDPALFAVHALLTAQLFNNAWLAIEKTGPGLAVIRTIWHDYHYPFIYRRKKHEQAGEGETDRIGWDTNRATKPLLIAGMEEALREGTHGIRSRRWAYELQTYVRLDNGKTVPEAGKFADLLMAGAIAQQVAIELPLRRHPDVKPKRERARQRVRYGAFRR